MKLQPAVLRTVLSASSARRVLRSVAECAEDISPEKGTILLSGNVFVLALAAAGRTETPDAA